MKKDELINKRIDLFRRIFVNGASAMKFININNLAIVGALEVFIRESMNQTWNEAQDSYHDLEILGSNP